MAQQESPPHLITGLPDKYIITPPFLDRLSAILARWPWWVIVVTFGLVIAFYSLLTIPLYHRILIFVTDNPQLVTNRIANVSYTVRTSEGTTERVSGILTNENSDSVTLITQDEVHQTVARSDIATLTCSGAATLDACPPNSPVTLSRKTVTGKLIQEGLGSYKINTIYQPEEIFKIGTLKEPVDGTWRNPTGCSADPNGTCSITIQVKPEDKLNQVSGTLLAIDSDSVTVQNAPPITRTIKKADIISTDNYASAQCALNNITSCNLGIFLTVWTTFGAFALALLLGLAFGLMRVSANPILYNVSTLYVEVIRGIPLLVILLFTGFVIEPWYHDNFASVGPGIALVVGVAAIAIAVGYLVSRGKQFKADPAYVIQPIMLTAVLGGLLVGLTLFLTANRVEDKFLRAALSGIAGGLYARRTLYS